MAFTGLIDATTPLGSEQRNLADDYMRAIKVAFQERLAVEHSCADDANDGRHLLSTKFNLTGTYAAIPAVSATYPGRLYWSTNASTTNSPAVYYDTGTAWTKIATSDHGCLAGLTDDDHTQYVLVAGTRSMTGNLLPGTTNTYDIGSSTYKWKDAYFAGNGAFGGTLEVTGTSSFTGAMTIVGGGIISGVSSRINFNVGIITNGTSTLGGGDLVCDTAGYRNIGSNTTTGRWGHAYLTDVYLATGGVITGGAGQISINIGLITGGTVTVGGGDLVSSAGQYRNVGADDTTRWGGIYGQVLNISGNSTLTGTLGVTGAATLSSTLGVTGATTLSSTLGVTGAATLESSLYVKGDTTLGDALSDAVTITGTATVGSTLTVTGAATFVSTLAVNGSATLGNNALVDILTIDSHINSSLTPYGTTGTHSIGGNLTRWKDLFLTGAIDCSGDIFSGGNIYTTTGYIGIRTTSTVPTADPGLDGAMILWYDGMHSPKLYWWSEYYHLWESITSA